MHVENDDLRLYILGQLSESRTTTVETHLRECEVCAAKVSEAARSVTLAESAELTTQQQCNLAGRERRIVPRVPTDEPAFMRVLSPLSPSRLEVRLLNFSKGGLMLQVPEAVSRGALVQVHVKKLIVLAEVRYCIPVGRQYHIGVQIRSVFSRP